VDGETSSADPQALLRYAEIGLRVDTNMEIEAARLRVILDEFAATCTEYKLGIDGTLTNRLLDIAARNRRHNMWVRRIAQQFIDADAGALGQTSLSAAPTAGANASGLDLASLLQAVLALMPPQTAATVVMLLMAGNVRDGLGLAGVLPPTGSSVGDDAAGLSFDLQASLPLLQDDATGNSELLDGLDLSAGDDAVGSGTLPADGLLQGLTGADVGLTDSGLTSLLAPQTATGGDAPAAAPQVNGTTEVDAGPGVTIDPPPPDFGPPVEDDFGEQGGDVIVDAPPPDLGPPVQDDFGEQGGGMVIDPPPPPMPGIAVAAVNEEPPDASAVAVVENPTVDPEAERFAALASDPSHGGAISGKTEQEARVGLDLEKSGQLPSPIRRDPTGASEFVDGEGTSWDVKAFNSRFPPGKGGYELGDSLTKIAKELRTGDNVILDTSNLSAAAINELKTAVEARTEWTGRVLWWP
jgi:hypothetical protein